MQKGSQIKSKSIFYKAYPDENESEDSCDEASNQLWGGSILSDYRMPVDGCQGSKVQLKASGESNPDGQLNYETHFHKELLFENDHSVDEDSPEFQESQTLQYQG